MQKTGKIAVLGDKDSIELFRAAGADTFSAKNEFEANDILKRLVKEDYAIIYVTEDVAALVPERIAKFKTSPFPAVIPIPSAGGSNGFGMRGVKADVEKAIGADVIFGADK